LLHPREQVQKPHGFSRSGVSHHEAFSMPVQWQIEMLGELRLTGDERVMTRFRTRETGLLLAYLAYYRDRSHPREALRECLWPDADPTSARRRLSAALTSLRRRLEPPGVPPGSVILADRDRIGLRPAAIDSDVAQFRMALRAARDAPERAARVQALSEALELYRGELLQGYAEGWVVQERQRLAEQYFAAVRQWLGELEEAGEIGGARQGAGADLLWEETHRHLLRLLSRAGRAQEASLALPTGTVTFLLTDIEGSTALWERTGERFAAALASHHLLLRRLFRQHGGAEVKELGDGFLVAFASAGDALSCALAVQRALADHTWPDGVGALRIRIALHTGAVQLQEGEYRGLVIHHAQRLLVAGHGGQILCSEATAALLHHDLGPGVRLVDLGVYRLRDVATPERLFQIDFPEIAGRQFPPLKAEPGYAASLPLSFTRFFDRETETADLSELLRGSDRERLVTLTGPGGSGKTRLALEVARQLSEAWRGALWFVPLAEVHEVALVGTALRDALPVPRAPDVDPFAQAAEFLAGQPSLVVLDNAEQLAPEIGPLLRKLQQRALELSLLVTSRRRLDVEGERELSLPPLPVPASPEALGSGPRTLGEDRLCPEPGPPLRGGAPQSPERLTAFPSVQLFVDRAQAARADFQITEANCAAVAALCRGLEGLPLAIELAAARAQVLTPAQMVAQLERRFEFLSSRRVGASARHRSLLGCVRWSYQLLPPELQRFFAMLSVFRGGWSLDAARAICGSQDALDALEQLRDCSLVLAEERGEAIRFRMLETLRDFASEQLAPNERSVLEQRHATFYLALAEAASAGLATVRGRGSLRQLEQEHDNLRAVLAWALEAQEADDAEARGELGLRLGSALARFWATRGYLAEGRESLMRLLARSERSAPTAARAGALHGVGVMSYHLGDYAASRTLCAESAAIARTLDAPEVVAAALHTAGRAAKDQGEYAVARALYEESGAIWRRLGERSGEAASLCEQGYVVYALGEYRLARACLDESLAMQQTVSDELGAARSQTGLGIVSYNEGDYPAARAFFEAAAAIWQQWDNTLGVLSSMQLLGDVSLQQGDFAAARVAFEECLTLVRKFGDDGNLTVILNCLGRIECREGNLARAEMLLSEALATARKVGDRRSTAWSLANLGSLALARGDGAAAGAVQREALAIRWSAGMQREVGDSLDALAAVAVEAGRMERAVRLLGASAALRERLGAPVPASERAGHERRVATARATLGEDAFAAAWAAGQASSLEAAVAEALEDA
jgi:predicted ATPase/class 3 adenylate cyclase